MTYAERRYKIKVQRAAECRETPCFALGERERGQSVLNIFYGDMPEAIRFTDVFFDNTYNDRWITKPLSREMIRAVDKSKVIDKGLILSPVYRYMDPTKLSGGVKTLILIDNDRKHVFNASNCGDNCAPWLLKIAEKKKVVINLRHFMDFGKKEFKIRVLNTGKIVKNVHDLVYEAGRYV